MLLSGQDGRQAVLIEFFAQKMMDLVSFGFHVAVQHFLNQLRSDFRNVCRAADAGFLTPKVAGLVPCLSGWLLF
jgi:hypothetical protein